jgi:predicted nucleotidyltransferase
MLTREAVNETLRKNKQGMQLQFHVAQIGLFGSYRRDEQRAGSDIDILVEFEKGHKDLFNYLRLKNYLEEILGTDVDLVMKEAVKPKLKNLILGQVSYV